MELKILNVKWIMWSFWVPVPGVWALFNMIVLEIQQPDAGIHGEKSCSLDEIFHHPGTRQQFLSRAYGQVHSMLYLNPDYRVIIKKLKRETRNSITAPHFLVFYDRN